ncbi:MAG: hypothetical protein HYX87_02905 [Chloroflexi bacterium]|nr:hypothetical protein [Chloroflexota bacterium]
MITSSFMRLARYTSASNGMADQCFVEIPHPIGGIPSEELEAKIKNAFPHILAAMTGWRPRASKTPAAKPSYPADTIKIRGTVSDIQELFFKRSLSTGLPFVPPTRRLVANMLAGTSHAPDEIVWDGIPPRMGIVTVELVAACAVMAGCKPQYMPTLLAIAEAMKEPELGYAHQATTTGTESLLFLISGPMVKEIGIACGTGAAGLCFQANASIGYAIGLISKVIGGSLPPDRDHSTLASPADLLNYVLGENEGELAWASYAVEQGYGKNEDLVTAKVVYQPLDISDHNSTTGKELLKYTAYSINQPYTTCMKHSPVLLGWCPEHADLLVRSGYTKASIRQYLWENARYPVSVYAKAAWDRGICSPNEDFPELRYGSETLVPIVAKPEDIQMIVCGGAGKHSQFWPGPKAMVSKRIGPWR